MTGSDDPMRDLLIQAVEGDDDLAQLLIAYFKILGNTDETSERNAYSPDTLAVYPGVS